MLLAAQLIPVHSGRATQVPDVRYRLRARVDDSTGLVTGTAEIRYRHLGPDPLRSLTLMLGHAAAGDSHSPSIKIGRRNDAAFNRILDLRLDGAPAALSWPGAPDSATASVALARPLRAGDSVVVTLGWNDRPADGRRSGRGRCSCRPR